MVNVNCQLGGTLAPGASCKAACAVNTTNIADNATYEYKCGLDGLMVEAPTADCRKGMRRRYWLLVPVLMSRLVWCHSCLR